MNSTDRNYVKYVYEYEAIPPYWPLFRRWGPCSLPDSGSSQEGHTSLHSSIAVCTPLRGSFSKKNPKWIKLRWNRRCCVLYFKSSLDITASFLKELTCLALETFPASRTVAGVGAQTLTTILTLLQANSYRKRESWREKGYGMGMQSIPSVHPSACMLYHRLDWEPWHRQ